MSVRPTNRLWLAAGPLGLAYSLAALAVAAGPGTYTTYAGRAPLVVTAAGMTLFVAGVASAFGPPGRGTGALFLIAGAVWFAPVWVGWSDGPPSIRALGAVAAGFLLPVVVHLGTTYSRVRVSAAARVLLAIVYGQAALSVAAHALFRDPFLDPNCWDNCITNAFLLHPLPDVVHAMDILDRWFVGAAGIALVMLSAQRFLTASSAGRRTLWPIPIGGAVVGAAAAAHSVALAIGPEQPGDRVFWSIFLVLAAGMMLLAAGPPLAWLRAVVQRRAVNRLTADLGDAPGPGSVQAALARVLGDTGLAIAYWVPSADRFVDAHGHVVDEPLEGSGRSVTRLVRDRRTLAAISHTAPAADVVRGFGGAVRLRLENERLQAEVLSRAEDIRASRARIVETGDAERRRLERDLHDGAQQRMLALSYHLRLARASAEAEGDDAVASLLASSTDEVLEMLEELRGLAHGIYPAILTEAGLGPALATLADAAPIIVELAVAQDDRLPPQVETAAYVVVSEAIDDAVARVATRVHVGVERDGGGLVLRLEDDGTPRAHFLQHVSDRVGALGGAVSIGPQMLHAEIPCA